MATNRFITKVEKEILRVKEIIANYPLGNSNIIMPPPNPFEIYKGLLNFKWARGILSEIPKDEIDNHYTHNLGHLPVLGKKIPYRNQIYSYFKDHRNICRFIFLESSLNSDKIFFIETYIPEKIDVHLFEQKFNLNDRYNFKSLDHGYVLENNLNCLLIPFGEIIDKYYVIGKGIEAKYSSLSAEKMSEYLYKVLVYGSRNLYHKKHEGYEVEFLVNLDPISVNVISDKRSTESWS